MSGSARTVLGKTNGSALVGESRPNRAGARLFRFVAHAESEHPPLTQAEVAAAIRFVAREHSLAVEVLLWGVCRSSKLIDACREKQPSPHSYAEVASLDGVVQALLLTSRDSRDLLRAGLRSSPPAMRQRVKATAPPPSAVSLGRDHVVKAYHLVAWCLPSWAS
jgi:hypothetical protein